MFRFSLVACAAILASGCAADSIKEAFGGGKQAPDEYQVVENAPLSVPPDFDLRPPKPGAPRPQTIDVRKQAEEALMGSARAPAKPGARSAGEVAFLSHAGVLDVDPGIRAILDRESSVMAATDEGFVDDLMFWQGTVVDGEVIDPAKEAERLKRENEANGVVSPATTPTIRRKN